MSRPGALAVFHAAEAGGPLRSLERELGWLAERCELTVALPATGTADPAFERLGAAAVLRGPYGALEAPRSLAGAAGQARSGPRELRWFRGLLRARPARVVLAVTLTVPAAVLAARIERVPSVIYAAELWAEAVHGPLRGGLARALLAAEARWSEAIVACSDAVARQLPAGAAATTIHPPIADAYSEGDGSGFRRRHAIPADAPCIACVGNVTIGRAQKLLVQAVSELVRSRPGMRAVIHGVPFARGGDAAYARELDELIGSLGLGETVVRTSGMEPVADVYAAADLVVNPATLPEAFGRVALEAGMAGTPAVCSRVGAVGELHTDGATALLVAPGDPGALAAAIERVLADPELGDRLAAGAAELARRIADPDRSLARFQRVLAPLL